MPSVRGETGDGRREEERGDTEEGKRKGELTILEILVRSGVCCDERDRCETVGGG